MNQQNQRKVLEEYNKGISVKALSEKFNQSKAWIQELLKRHGVIFHRIKQNFDE
jgi:predicted DNA-binding protein YlxM (UPF0122 family)